MTGMRHRVYAALCALLAIAGISAAQLRVATWNITRYDGNSRAADIQTSVYGSYLGRTMAPDVLLVQELTNASARNALVAVLNSAPGSPGDWAAAPFVQGPDTNGVCLYRTSKATLVGNTTWVIALGSSSSDNQPRNTYRYDIRPVGYSAPTTVISMYNVHMKAGSSSTDQARRLVESERIRANASGVNTNGPGSAKPVPYHFLVAGDFNIQTASQQAFAHLVESQADNSGRFFDPIRSGFNSSNAGDNGSWNNNGAYRFIHTQDPIGAGGMDDRLDMILLSVGLINGQGLTYIGNPNISYSKTTWNDPNHSYRAWGNDGTSFDTELTVAGNTMVGAAIAQALKNVATPPSGNPGGHLPVYLDIRVPPTLAAPSVIDFGEVEQGSLAQISFFVGNGGDVFLWGPQGVSSLGYTMQASGAYSVPFGPFFDAAGGALNSHTVTLNTANVGTFNGAITILSDAPDAPSWTVTLTGTVATTNQPPVANAGPDLLLADFDGTGFEPVLFDGSASYDPDGEIVLYTWRLGAQTLASVAQPTVVVDLPVGVHEVVLTVTDDRGDTDSDDLIVTIVGRPNQPPVANAGEDQTVIDEDRSGEALVTLDGSASTDADGQIVLYTWSEPSMGELSSSDQPTADVMLPWGVWTITLTVTDDQNDTGADTVTITVEPPCPADFNNDGGVDGADVEAFFVAWEAGDPIADINADGGVDGGDVEAFFIAWEAGGC
jgi:endonuclease/exonuclease/phosphatase family metal-dependent hydrolase